MSRTPPFGGAVLILGKSGQVSRALKEQLGEQAVALSRQEADLSRPDTLPAILAAYHPSLIINAAAYTQVDKAEEERELAFAVNATAPGVLARFCSDQGIPLIHYSTDYVFDGNGSAPWREDDRVAPLGVYAESKAEGEALVREAGGQHLILRTSWVYDEEGKNFLNTMLRLGREKKELRVVADQWGAPTYAGDLAGGTLILWRALREHRIEARPGPDPALPLRGPQDLWGTYHLCNTGETTWHGFAEAIFAEARAYGESLAVERIIPITTTEYPTPAKRPLNSRLDCGKAEKVFGLQLPAWQEGLKTCMTRKYAGQGLPDTGT